MKMSFSEAQGNMQEGYCSGGPGILASAIAWACAAGVAAYVSTQAAVWVLLIGGVLIFPVSVLFCKLLGARGMHDKGNPLGSLAGASTFWLIFAIVIALVISWHRQSWFFPAMLLTIGGRYLIFATVYGMRRYWILGLLLAATGIVTFALSAPPTVSAAVGAIIEGVFSVVCILHYFRQVRPNMSMQRTLSGRR